MKAHIHGTPTRDPNETRAQRLQRLKLARAIKAARKEDKKPKESNDIQARDASMLGSIETDSRDLHF